MGSIEGFDGSCSLDVRAGRMGWRGVLKAGDDEGIGFVCRGALEVIPAGRRSGLCLEVAMMPAKAS